MKHSVKEAAFWLKMENVSVSYSNNYVLSHLTISLRKGINILIGKNGVGKSTFLGLIAGLVKKSQGEVNVLGYSPYKFSKQLFEYFSFLPENIVDYGGKTVEENMILYTKLRKTEPGKIVKYVSYFDVDYMMKSSIATLSLGEAKLYSLILCLATEAEYYIMDEPSSNLYVGNRLKLAKLIRRMGEEGKTFLIATHVLDEFPSIADEIILMNTGGFIKGNRNGIESIRGEETAIVVSSDNPNDLNNILNKAMPTRIIENEIIVFGKGLSEIMSTIPEQYMYLISTIKVYPKIIVEAIYEDFL